MCFYGWMHEILISYAKERHFILPLVIWTFIMQSVAFIASTSQDRIKLIFSILIDHTYLESNFYCLQQ